MKYITQPPNIPPVPDFIAKRYPIFDKDFVERLIAWSNKEYYEMTMHLFSIGQSAKAKHLQHYCTNADFVAHTSAFKKILTYMRPEIWRELNSYTRNTLIDARNILSQAG